MQHCTFADNEEKEFKIAILIKDKSFNKELLKKYYVDSMIESGINPKDIIAFSLDYDEYNKSPVKLIREYLGTLLPILEGLKVETLFVPDSPYFKVLAGLKKVEGKHGYVLPCKIPQHESLEVITSTNYQALYHNPSFQTNIDLSIEVLTKHLSGDPTELGDNVIGKIRYPNTLEKIKKELEALHHQPVIVCDVETAGLNHRTCGLATIAFSWNEHDGIAIPVDRFHCEITGHKIKGLLEDFFRNYKGKVIYHNATFDILVLIWNLFMDEFIESYEDFLTGLEIMTRDIEDTKIITYLAVNSCVGNTLGLKPNTHTYMGDYGVDVKDTRKIPLTDLLEYNLKDCLATYWLYLRNYPRMVQDQQEKVYLKIFKPSLKVIIAMEYTGMPILPDRVLEVEKELLTIRNTQLDIIYNNNYVKSFAPKLRKAEWKKKHAGWKNKKVPLEDPMWDEYEVLNPNSRPQLAGLLYKHIGLPVIDLTDKKKPATGGNTCEKLVHHTNDPDAKELLNALIEYAAVDKILTDFIERFKKANLHADGHYYLHGSFKLGGTVSGRLASSDPNMQNLPSGSKYGKLIKSCFAARKDELFVGADFASLEDRISALQTKDPNKLKVYTGHKVYEITVDGVCHRIRDDDTIEYDGKTYTGEEFHENYTNGTL